MIALLRRAIALLLRDRRLRCERCGRLADPTIVGQFCARHRPRRVLAIVTLRGPQRKNGVARCSQS